jgi:curved DNA-binding protein CbpA
VATHYDLLGVRPTADAAEIRRAYLDRARSLHPDAFAGRPEPEIDAARRAMQDVNEAWRVLREPSTRAEYDRSLRSPSPPPRPASESNEPWLDRPYRHPVAEPGDVGVAIARAAPWIAILVVLAIIFVFTAVARDRAGDDLVGKCVQFLQGEATEQPCTAENDGRVVDIVAKAEECAGATVPRAAGPDWYCLVDVDAP